jgi:ABC-type lipoprotein export system ATPase subunit
MADAPPILEFEAAVLADPQVPAERLEGVSLTVRAGECIVVRPRLAIHEEEDGVEYFPLADAAQGLFPCLEGTVRFMGRPWTAFSLREEARSRARIGRVFPYHAWVHNLSVLENLTLAGRYHRLAPVAALEQRAFSWARRFGLDTIPDARPGFVRKTDLRRLEWVRAFLNEPVLLLLESPEMDAPGGALSLLSQAVEEARARGAAVVWITDDPRLAASACAHGANRYEAVDGRLERIEERR